jgi:hypothetical protein
MGLPVSGSPAGRVTAPGRGASCCIFPLTGPHSAAVHDWRKVEGEDATMRDTAPCRAPATKACNPPLPIVAAGSVVGRRPHAAGPQILRLLRAGRSGRAGTGRSVNCSARRSSRFALLRECGIPLSRHRVRMKLSHDFSGSQAATLNEMTALVVGARIMRGPCRRKCKESRLAADQAGWLERPAVRQRLSELNMD